MSHLICKNRNSSNPEMASLAHQYNFFHPAELDAFNLPLYQHFADGKMFVAVAMGRIDLDRLLAAYGEKLCRGAQVDRVKVRSGWKTEHRQLLFQLEQETWLFMNANVGCARVFARDAATAETTVRDVMNRFRARRKPGKPQFFLVSMADNSVSTTQVALESGIRRPEKELALLYGEDFPSWEQSLTATLSAPRPGAIILRGPPGVGKTSFIRHLMARLRRTHRFYVLPTSDFELLTSPRLVNFWAEEAQYYKDLHKVVVLEDAEAVLEDRRDGNRGAIANLLNIADGLLADFLKVKLLCTVNCPLDRLDPAVVRGGRLLAYREFTRIPRERAERIAATHNLNLEAQTDYSLAEIFAGSPKAKAAESRKILGFAASAA